MMMVMLVIMVSLQPPLLFVMLMMMVSLQPPLLLHVVAAAVKLFIVSARL